MRVVAVHRPSALWPESSADPAPMRSRSVPMARGEGSSAGAIERVRGLCMAWPEVTERPSHGEAAWFFHDKRSIATTADHHHDDRVAVWLAAPPGARDELVEREPNRYFVPPYVGHRGWIGAYLDVDVDWARLEELVADAYHTVTGRGR